MIYYPVRQNPIEKSTFAGHFIAVRLIDCFSLDKPIGRINIYVNEKKTTSLEKSNGIYIILDISLNTCRLKITSENYFTSESIINDLSRYLSKNRLKKIYLIPLPSYPFIKGTTLIRGFVKFRNGKNVCGAQVRSPRLKTQTMTNSKGEFAIHFKDITDDDITCNNGKRYILQNYKKKISLEARYKNKKGEIRIMNVEEGVTTVLNRPIILRN